MKAFRNLLAVLIAHSLCLSAFARTTIRLEQSVDITEASIRDYQYASFTFNYSVSSTNDDVDDLAFGSLLNPWFEGINVIRSADVETVAITGTLVSIRFKEELPSGTAGQIIIQARFKQTTPVNTIALNGGLMTANSSPPVGSNLVSVKAINAPIVTGPTFTNRVTIRKSGPTNVNPGTTGLAYYIYHGFEGAGGSWANNYSIVDNFPPGTSLNYFRPDNFGSATSDVSVLYKTNQNSAWRRWTVGPTYTLGTDGYYGPSSLPLNVNENVIGLRFEYGNLPGGGTYHPTNMNRELTIYLNLDNRASLTPGSIVQNCAAISTTNGLAANNCNDSVVIPGRTHLGMGVASDGVGRAIGEQVRLTYQLYQQPDSIGSLTNPTISVRLPWTVAYDRFEARGDADYVAAGSPQPIVQTHVNFPNPGETTVTFRFDGFTLPTNGNYNSIYVDVYATVQRRVTNGYYWTRGYATWGTPVDAYTWDRSPDTLDMDRDGNVTEPSFMRETAFLVETGGNVATVNSKMFVKGDRDATWVTFPALGTTTPGGDSEYRLVITNPGGIGIRDFVVIDTLPHVGDTGVVDLSPRNSEWSPYLVSEVTPPAGATIYYSTSRNPCRDELTPGLPVGCEPANWTTSPPADITTVGSFKFDFASTLLQPSDEVVIEWSMRTPWSVTPGQIAWNSFGYKAMRADNGTWLPAAEPNKTGIVADAAVIGGMIGDRAWIDANNDGLQTAGENGQNGLRAFLFADNGDGIVNPSSDQFLRFTATFNEAGVRGSYFFGGLAPRKYFVILQAPLGMGATIANVGGNDAIDSDGSPIIYRGRRCAVSPMIEIVGNERQLDHDQGFLARPESPEVWAFANHSSGMVIGGRFSHSHGVPRRNIACLQSNGQVDPRFNPGSGFNGPVRSLATLPDGRIWVGGNFSIYNGQLSRGVAIIDANGTWDSRTARPDTESVNWVAASGTSLYVAGLFGKVGIHPAGCLARLKMDGTVDVSFSREAGANGEVFDGAVLPDGKIIVVGAFTKYNGITASGVVRLKPNGDIDPSFNSGSGASGEVYTVKALDDGRITLAGTFRSFNGTTCNGTVRLLPDGAVDTTLLPSSLAVQSINTSN
jgi:hypothetical protein